MTGVLHHPLEDLAVICEQLCGCRTFDSAVERHQAIVVNKTGNCLTRKLALNIKESNIKHWVANDLSQEAHSCSTAQPDALFSLFIERLILLIKTSVLEATEKDCGQLLPLGLAYEVKLLSIVVLSKLKLLLTESVPDFNGLSGWLSVL